MENKIERNNNKKSEKSNDPLELKGLTPDELADQILGISEAKPDFDEAADPDAAKFWYQAAYADEMQSLFKEKNRMRILVAGLMKRGYKEEEVKEIFTRIAKAKLFSEKAVAEAEEKSREISNKITRLVILILSVFVIYQLLLKTNQAALDEENRRIAKIKTFACMTNQPPFYMKTDEEVEWHKVITMKKDITEKFNLRTEKFPATIVIPGSSTLILDSDSEIKIERIELDKKNEVIKAVDFELKKGLIHWNIQEKAGLIISLTTPSWNLKIKYGEGKADRRTVPERIAVREGETIFSNAQTRFPVPVNGLMEMILKNPPLKRLYNDY
ncbi:hypothetical protein MASR1M12_27880 [Erysipelotrichia bacterium]